MDQSRIFQYRQTLEELLSKHLHELRTQSLELILLDQFVQIRRETLEHQAQVAFVRERVEHPQYVILVVRVVFTIQLRASATTNLGHHLLTRSRIATSIFD